MVALAPTESTPKADNRHWHDNAICDDNDNYIYWRASPPDPHDCGRLFGALYGNATDDDGTILILSRANKVSRRFPASKWQEAAAFVSKTDPDYFKPNLFDTDKVTDKSVGKADAIKAITCIGIDVDCGKQGYHSRDEALAALESMPVPASVIVSTKPDAGLHAYWVLAKPIRIDSKSHQAELQAIATRWEDHLRDLLGGQLDATSDQARMLRPAGTYNHKYGCAVDVYTDTADCKRYSIEDLTLPELGTEPASVEPEPCHYGDETLPGTLFNRNPKAPGIIAGVMEQQGYKVWQATDGTYRFDRPGSQTPMANGRFGDKSPSGNWQLVMWSPNSPLPVNKSITLHQAYADLCHGGDLSEATRALADMGFSDETPVQGYVAPEFVGNSIETAERPELHIDPFNPASLADRACEIIRKAGTNLRCTSSGVAHMLAEGSLVKLWEASPRTIANELMQHIDFVKTDAEGKQKPHLVTESDPVVQTIHKSPMLQGLDRIDASIVVAGETLLTPSQLHGNDDLKIISGHDFWETSCEREYLVDGLLSELQPAVMGGPSKALKTNISAALAVSLATGSDFLDTFPVSRPCKVLFFSAESGRQAIRSSVQRIARSVGCDTDMLKDNWQFAGWVPHTKIGARFKRYVDAVERIRPDVVIVDPVYQATDGEDSANVQKMGQQFAMLSTIATDVGATPIYVHHTTKAPQNVLTHSPLELVDLQGAGVSEYFRQWILINRRSKYQHDGKHQLWLTGGGSEGHSYRYGLDINEYFSGKPRGWDAVLRHPDDVAGEAEDRKETAKRRRADEQQAVCVMAIARMFLYGNRKLLSMSSFRDGGKPLGSNRATREAVEQMVKVGALNIVPAVSLGVRGVIAVADLSGSEQTKYASIATDYYSFDANKYTETYRQLPEGELA